MRGYHWLCRGGSPRIAAVWRGCFETRRKRLFSSQLTDLHTCRLGRARFVGSRSDEIVLTVVRWSSGGNESGPNDEEDNTKRDSLPPNIWDQLGSVPNIITMIRMASTPGIAYLIVTENYSWAFAGCIAAGISDGLDGYIAKHYNSATVVGTYLDPLADKVLINSLGLSLWYSGLLPSPLVILWGTKDVILLLGTGWYLYRRHQSLNIFITSVAKEPLSVTPSTVGKVNTVLQFGTLGVALCSPVVDIPPWVLEYLCWSTGMTTIGSVLSYTGRAGMGVEKNE